MFDKTFDPRPGVPFDLGPGLRLILAPNPSPMTERGTNTYLVGSGDVTVIDPGPAIEAHLDAILAALQPGERIERILVTHAHRDHVGLAEPLAEATGAAIHAYGSATEGRSEVMVALAAEGLAGGEGLDTDFQPHERLNDGESVSGLVALHTPGHAANHLSFGWGDLVFTGDTVMGWASTMVSPPDGDVTAFMASVARLGGLGARVFLPAHGAPVANPAARCEWLLAHRRKREAAIRAALPGDGATVPEIAASVYVDTPEALLPAAERNVLAHLIDLESRGLVTADPRVSSSARFIPVRSG